MRNSHFKSAPFWVTCFFLAGMLPALLPATAYAQAQTCQNLIEEANTLYSRGAFDETIALLDQCLESENLDETQRKTAYRLKGLSFIGKGLEVDARESVKRLLQLVPNYEPDPVMDPPNFVAMITEVREEIEAQVNATPVNTTPAEPEQVAEETDDPPAQPEVATPEPVVEVATQPVQRRKKGGKKWLIGGLGVAAAGGLAAVLLSGGGGGGGGDTIAEPPALP